jgi:hypothetical protein
MIPLNLTEHKGNRLTNIIGCKRETRPIKYLGVSLHLKKLRIRD